MIFSKDKLFKLKKALLSLGDVATEDGTTLVYDGDTLEVGMEVFIDGEEGLEPAPDKVYTSGDKTIEVVGGIVQTITMPPVGEPVEETVEETTEETEEVAEEPAEETVEETEETTTEETVEEPAGETTEETVEETEETVEDVEDVDELKAVIEEQKNLIEDLKNQIEELKKKLEEPAGEPAGEEFRKQVPETKSKIDFTKYIRK